MVSGRYRANNGIGNKLTALERKAAEARNAPARIVENSVGENALREDSVGPEALKEDSVTSTAVARGAIGTENLGTVDQISSTDTLVLKGAGYTAATEGVPRGLSMDSKGAVRIGGTVLSGTVAYTYTAGPVEVILEDTGASVFATSWPSDIGDPQPGDVVSVGMYNGVFRILARHTSTTVFANKVPVAVINGSGSGSDQYPRYLNPTNVALFEPTVTDPVYGYGFSKSAGGIVSVGVMLNLLSGRTASGNVLMTLPVGFRPARNTYFSVINNGVPRRALVSTNGEISIASSGWTAAYISLSKIVFPTDFTAVTDTGLPIFGVGITPFTSFVNGWTAATGSFSPQLFVDKYGTAFPSGGVVSGTVTNGTAMFTIPPMTTNGTLQQYSEFQQHFPGISSNGGFAGHSVDNTNLYKVKGGTTAGTVYLDGNPYQSVSQPSNTWYTPTKLNSWVRNGVSQPDLQYSKRQDGMVMLRGLASGGASGTTIFTLPAGYRPRRALIFPGSSSDTYGRLDISAGGNVTAASSSGWFSLDGVMFPAEQ